MRLDVRMESWLPADTIRRAGFGHVVANRRHVLTLERGVSLVLLGPDGRLRGTHYASGLFAPLPRVLARLAPPPGDSERAMLGLRGFDLMTAVSRGCPWLVGVLLARR